MRRSAFTPLFIALLAMTAPVLAETRIVVVNVDFENEGFNDPTPAEPVGGNAGTTVGEQRLIAFQHAANLWAAQLDSPVEIRIEASFDPLVCTRTTVVLGSAGTASVYGDFANAPLPRTWYVGALASKLAGEDMDDGTPAMTARFNSNLTGNRDCGGGLRWYYGLDNKAGINEFDLVVVVLHELGHGLGFATTVDKGSGELLGGRHDVYATFLFDDELGRSWPQMSDQERAQSARKARQLSWIGASAVGAAPDLLSFAPMLEIHAPASLEGTYDVGPAEFGGEVTIEGVRARIVAAMDPANEQGPEPTDACSAIFNASEVRGKIALVDRGGCVFVTKATNVQAAGAVALIVANDDDGPTPLMTGDGRAISIPVVGVTRAEGAAIRGQLGAGVEGTIRQNPFRHAGLNAEGRPLLHSPLTLEPGSSVSHWDRLAEPDLLMEPIISAGLGHDLDLTRNVLEDLGWDIEVSVGASLRYEILTDRDRDFAVDPGDVLRLIAEIRNGTGLARDDVRLDVALPQGLTAVPGSTTGGAVVTEEDRVIVELGTLVPGGGAKVTFDLEVDPGLPAATTSIAIQGSVLGTNLSIITDDPATVTEDDPTIVVISHPVVIERRVPSDFATIQAAVDAASHGEHVVVAPGTYREPIDLRGKKITLRSFAGANLTILDGGGQPTAIITAISGESLQTVVQGFTFRNGAGRFTDACAFGGSLGGAIFVQNGGISVLDSVFENNGGQNAGEEREIDAGGAIFACNADLAVAGSTFLSNAANFGGAILFAASAHHGSIEDSRFVGNDSGHGGGIFTIQELEASIVLRDLHFEENMASHGGSVRLALRDRSRAEMTRAVVRDGASAFGGAINVSTEDRASASFSSIDLIANEAGFGGGIFAIATGQLPANPGGRISIDRMRSLGNVAHSCCDAGLYIDSCFRDGEEGSSLFYGGGADFRTLRGGEITISNSLFAGNSGLVAGGAHASSCDGGSVRFVNATVVENQPSGLHFRLDVPEDRDNLLPGRIDVVNSIVRGNGANQIPVELLAEGPVATVTYSNVEGGFQGEGNLDLSPLFVDAGRCDYRLDAGSPGIDGGSNAALAGFDEDLDRKPRFADDPGTPDTGAGMAPLVDIGALERQNPENVFPLHGRRRGLGRPYAGACFKQP